jgi:hypothetical protein
MEAHDGSGSGLDEGSFEVRISEYQGDWSQWGPIISINGTDLSMRYFKIEFGPGTFKVQVRCKDMVGWTANSNIIHLTVEREMVNQPPKPVIRIPLNDTWFKNGAWINLDATGTWDDGLGPFNPIHLTWVSNISRVIGTGGQATIQLDQGHHQIVLFADDGEYNISCSVNIHVGIVRDPDKNDDPIVDPIPEESDLSLLWFIIMVAVLILTVGIIILLLMKKRKDDAEVRMEIVERTEDDDLYDKDHFDDDW